MRFLAAPPPRRYSPFPRSAPGQPSYSKQGSQQSKFAACAATSRKGLRGDEHQKFMSDLPEGVHDAEAAARKEDLAARADDDRRLADRNRMKATANQEARTKKKKWSLHGDERAAPSCPPAGRVARPGRRDRGAGPLLRNLCGTAPCMRSAHSGIPPVIQSGPRTLEDSTYGRYATLHQSAHETTWAASQPSSPSRVAARAPTSSRRCSRIRKRKLAEPGRACASSHALVHMSHSTSRAASSHSAG
jgi:hypothetical protein